METIMMQHCQGCIGGHTTEPVDVIVYGSESVWTPCPGIDPARRSDMDGKTILDTCPSHAVTIWDETELTSMIDSALAQARAEEREACANIAEEEDACQTEYNCDTGERAARAIRARTP